MVPGCRPYVRQGRFKNTYLHVTNGLTSWYINLIATKPFRKSRYFKGIKCFPFFVFVLTCAKKCINVKKQVQFLKSCLQKCKLISNKLFVLGSLFSIWSRTVSQNINVKVIAIKLIAYKRLIIPVAFNAKLAKLTVL